MHNDGKLQLLYRSISEMQSEVDTKVARLTDRLEDKERRKIYKVKQYKWNRLCSTNDSFLN